MKSDLDTLKTEIEKHLEKSDFAVYHGHPRFPAPGSVVPWDSEEYPDFQLFLEVARQLGVRLIVFHHRRLEGDFIDHLIDRLESADVSDEEYAGLHRRLHDLRVYQGFTSALELSFDYQGRTYLYNRRSDWYDELLAIADELGEFDEEEEGFGNLDEENDGPYFSRN